MLIYEFVFDLCSRINSKFGLSIAVSRQVECHCVFIHRVIEITSSLAGVWFSLVYVSQSISAFPSSSVLHGNLCLTVVSIEIVVYCNNSRHLVIIRHFRR